jgi:predicted CoA-binding protein
LLLSEEGLPCFKSVSELPAEVKSVSIITPPAVTEVVVREAVAKGIENSGRQRYTTLKRNE